MKTAKRRLIIDITFDLDEVEDCDVDAALAECETKLRDLHDLAYGEGMFTGDSAVTVASTEVTVETPFQGPTQGYLKVSVRTDNDAYDFECYNDAWFKELSKDDLAYLCQDTSANEVWDRFFYDSPPLHEKWEAMQNMLGSQDPNDHHEMVGFTVGICDEIRLHAWVRSERPDAWEIYKNEYDPDADQVLLDDLQRSPESAMP